jgi:hypothetical protein
MTTKERFKLLDAILLHLQDKCLDESMVWYLDQIAFLKDIDLKTIIELQSILYRDSYVHSSIIYTNKTFPLKLTTSGIQFISKGGYTAVWKKEKRERLKTTIILSGVIFSIFVGIISTGLSIINYKNSKNEQNKKIEILQEKCNKNELEIENLKNAISSDTFNINSQSQF